MSLSHPESCKSYIFPCATAILDFAHPRIFSALLQIVQVFREFMGQKI
jgi:hypothetical protein